MVERGKVASVLAGVVARLPARAGVAGLWAAHGCGLLLFATLAWGPHWPFSRFGIVAPLTGLLDGGFDLADLLVVGILASWGVALLTGQDRPRWGQRWISRPLLLLAFAAALACVGALDRSAAFRLAIRTTVLAMLFLYLRSSLCRGRLTPAAVAWWLAPGLAANGLLAIAQTLHQDPLGLIWLGEPGMYRSAPGAAVVLVDGKPWLRAFGVLPHPNVLGGLLAAGLPLVAGLLLDPQAGGVRSARDAPSGHPARPGRDTVLLLCLALMAAGLVLSLSRSAWIGLLVGGLYLVCWRAGIRWRLTRRALLAGNGIGLVVAALLLVEWDAVSVRLQPDSNQLERYSLEQRLSLQELTFKVIAWRPLTGVGGNNLVGAEARFLPPGGRTVSPLLPVHNTYLLAQAELGPLGASAWLAVMLVPMVGLALRVCRRQDIRANGAGGVVRLSVGGNGAGVGQSPQQVPAWQALAGWSLMVVAVAGLFDFYIWVNEPVAVLWVVALALFSATVCPESCGLGMASA